MIVIFKRMTVFLPTPNPQPKPSPPSHTDTDDQILMQSDFIMDFQPLSSRDSSEKEDVTVKRL